MLRYCRVELRDYGIETIYPDGSRSANWIPTIEREAFVRLSESLGFRDPLEYLRHHDLSHSFLSDRMFGIVSPTLYSAAHGECRHGVIDRRQNHYEERERIITDLRMRAADFGRSGYGDALDTFADALEKQL
jgi:hypothetical protein